MIWKIGCGARMNQNPDFNMAVKAFRKVDFVVSSDLQMTPDCQYSDIVLPASSFWERFGGVLIQTNRELLIYSSQVVPPLFECRHDSWIQAQLCRRWALLIVYRIELFFRGVILSLEKFVRWINFDYFRKNFKNN